MAKIIGIKGKQLSGKPVFYYYQQQFDYKGERKSRTGFICGVKLEHYDKGIILPHQEILPNISDERLALLKNSGDNIGPVLGLYNDFAGSIDQLIQQAAGANVDVQFTDADGAIHSLTAINDDAVIQQVQQQMERQRIFIANGHHSYDAALRYAQENPQANYITMALMNLYDPNLIILPVHRLIKDVPDLDVDKFMQQLREDYVVEPFNVNQSGENIEEFMQALYHRGGFDYGLGIEHCRTFGLYTGNGQGYLVTLESETTMDQLMPKEGYSLALQGIDVFVLHYTVLQRLLGIGRQNQAETAEQKHQKADTNIKRASVVYTRKEIEALRKVDSGQCQLAFLLNPVVFDEFTAVAIGGELMPPKSTYFYPPLPADLLKKL
ncbi:DUF1015 domain-containing protein [Peptococcaceae bacterium 1198_IL3148]